MRQGDEIGTWKPLTLFAQSEPFGSVTRSALALLNHSTERRSLIQRFAHECCVGKCLKGILQRQSNMLAEGQLWDPRMHGLISSILYGQPRILLTTAKSNHFSCFCAVLPLHRLYGNPVIHHKIPNTSWLHPGVEAKMWLKKRTIVLKNLFNNLLVSGRS